MSEASVTLNSEQAPRYKHTLSWLIALIAPFVLFGLFLLSQGINPLLIFKIMYNSAFGNMYGFGEVVIKTTPFILAALATALPARAGLINVGGEGQLAMGALMATFAAVFLFNGWPGWSGIPLLMLFGVLGGMLWAGITACLKVFGKMNETITTLLMNYVAFFLLAFCVHGVLKDPNAFNWPFSPPLSSGLRLPTIPGSRIHIGIILAIFIAFIVWYLCVKTRWGFQLKVVGANPLAALRSGINVKQKMFWALVIGGGLAGLAGAIELAGIEGRLRPTTGMDYGYLGFLAAWMARNHPLWVVLTAFVLGTIMVSGVSLEMRSGLPSSSMYILMGLILLSILATGRRLRT